MIDNQETQGKIAAEVRDLSKCIRNKVELGEYIDVPMPTAFGKPLDVYYAELADRIDAAAKRDEKQWEEAACHCVSSTVQSGKIAVVYEQPGGNAMKLRKAVYDALAMLEHFGQVHDARLHVADLVSVGNAKAILLEALKEPPRECDVGTADEQTDRFKDLCRKYRRGPGPRANCKGCPIQHKSLHVGCTFEWAQMPYESEAAR